MKGLLRVMCIIEIDPWLQELLEEQVGHPALAALELGTAEPDKGLVRGCLLDVKGP